MKTTCDCFKSYSSSKLEASSSLFGLCVNCVSLSICKCLNLAMFINVSNIPVREKKLLRKQIKLFIKLAAESYGSNDQHWYILYISISLICEV